MGENYTKFWEREEAWAQELDTKNKKQMYLWSVLIPVICVAGLFAIGFLAGGRLENGISNIKYGAILAAFVDVVYVPIVLLGMPGKRYRKHLKKLIEEMFPQSGEREEFAAQMLGIEGENACIDWKRSGSPGDRVWVSRDYVLRSPGAGYPQIMELKKVDKIETDAYKSTYQTGSAGVKVRTTVWVYTITFQYKEQYGQMKKKGLQLYKPSLSFDSREIRDKVLAAIERLHT